MDLMQGGGGGGAGTLGQTTNQGPPGIPSNPPSIPADHPNYPSGGGGGNGPFPGTAPYNGPTPNPLLESPFTIVRFGSTAADYQSNPEVGLVDLVDGVHHSRIPRTSNWTWYSIW